MTGRIEKIILNSDLPTPFFIYDFSKIQEQFTKLEKVLPSKVSIFYSVKTNPSLAILKFIQRLGLGAEITSSGELSAVQRVEFPSEKIIFTGPGKTDEELEKAIRNGVYLIIAESLKEIERIERISRNLKKNQSILMRINLSQSIKNGTYKMSSGPQKFGIDEEVVENVILRASDFKNIKLLGVHFYGASGISNYSIISKNIKFFLNLIRKVELTTKFRFSIVDMGLGLGVNSHISSGLNKKNNINEFGRALKILLKTTGFNDRKIILEIGRFLVAGAGSYVAKVIDIKESRGRKFIIIDGGMNHLARAGLEPESHYIGIIKRSYIKYSPRNASSEKVDIAGPLATPTDILIRNTFLPAPAIGDLVIINKVGAYGFTSGMLYFSSRPLPAEYALINGKLEVIRKRKGEKDFFIGQMIPRSH